MPASSTISLRCIRSFIAIADHGSFRQAADALSISQPALSAHMRDLETQLGVTLLRRTTRVMELTDKGRQFLDRVRRTVADLDAVILDLREQAAVERGHVTVACVPSIAAGLYPGVVRAFVAQQPHTTVQICDERTEIIEDRVLRSQADFGVAPGYPRNPALAFEPVADDPYFVICPIAHPLARQKAITLAQFAKHPLISMRPEQSMRRLLDDAARSRGLRLHTVHEVFHHDTLMGMVAEGLGIGAMPSLTISMLRQRDVAIVPLIDPKVSRKIGLLTRRGEPLAGASLALATATRRELVARLSDDSTRSKPRKVARQGTRT